MPKSITIAGHTFLFTGTLTEFTRAEAEALVEANGGKVVSGVSTKLNYLVVGLDAGSKLEKAKALGTVKILKEKEFLKMVPKEKANSKTFATTKKPAADTKKSSTAVSTSLVQGKSFYFLCMFEVTDDLLTTDAKELVVNLGGIVAGEVTRDVDYLVRSSSDTTMSALMQTRLQRAKDFGTVKIISGKAFEKMTSRVPVETSAMKAKPVSKKKTKPQQPDYRTKRFGNSELQVKSSIDTSQVDYSALEADAKRLGVDMSIFEMGSLLSDSPDSYSSTDLFEVLNPEVILLINNHLFLGSLRVIFSENPSSCIYPPPEMESSGAEYGRIHKNMHLTIDKDATGTSLSLEREHYYECDDEIDDDGDTSANEIQQIMKDVELRDNANKTWPTFEIDGVIEDNDLASYRDRFYETFREADMFF